MGYYDRGYSQWPAYVSVAERKKKAEKHIAANRKKGVKLNPVVISGRAISVTFWGKAWCENLEAYSDYENRLPRGRTYVRNGSVIDLKIAKGQVKAQVMGSSLYHVAINIKAMPEAKWKTLVKACAGKIDSLIELLNGKFSKAVMEIITRKGEGLFPKPQELSMSCSCPDSASMCKHVAAVLYGVGAILDVTPESIFALRHVQHSDLIATASQGAGLIQSPAGDNALVGADLSALFGIAIDLDETLKPKAKTKAKVITTPKKAPKKAVKEKSVVVKPKVTPKPKIQPKDEIKPKSKPKLKAKLKSKA